MLFDKFLIIGDKHKPRFISNFAKSRHLDTHTVDAIFSLLTVLLDNYRQKIQETRFETVCEKSRLEYACERAVRYVDCRAYYTCFGAKTDLS